MNNNFIDGNGNFITGNGWKTLKEWCKPSRAEAILIIQRAWRNYLYEKCSNCGDPKEYCFVFHYSDCTLCNDGPGPLGYRNAPEVKERRRINGLDP